MKLNRLGRFSITIDCIENVIDDMMQLMGQLIVVRAEMLYESEAIYYTAHSALFDEIKQGDAIPEYRIIVHKSNTGVLKFAATRVD